MYLARHLWIVAFKDGLIPRPYAPTPQEELPPGEYYLGRRVETDVLAGKVLGVTFDRVTIADWLFEVKVAVPGAAIATPPAAASSVIPSPTISASATARAVPAEIVATLYPNVAISSGVTVFAPTFAAGTDAASPLVSSAAIIAIVPLPVSALLPPPHVHVFYGVEVRAPPLAASAMVLTPSVSAGAVVQAVSAKSATLAPGASTSGSAVALAVPLAAIAGVILPGVSAGVGVAVPAFSTVASLSAPLVSVTVGSAAVEVPAFGVAAAALLAGVSGSATEVPPAMIVASGLPAPDAHAAVTAFAGTALSQALSLVPTVAGSGNVIAPALEAGGIFVAPPHIGGLTSIFYELILNELAVYVLVAVDGITYVLPLNPEVVINLAQRN